MTDLNTILKAKLSRGSALNVGELSLVLRDIMSLIDDLEAQIAAQQEELTTLAKRGAGGSKSPSKAP